MTSPNGIYIPIELTYKDYKAEYFVAYIDSGLGSCLCKWSCFPKKYTKKLKEIVGPDISNKPIHLSEGLSSWQILLGDFLVKYPPFYFHDTGTNILLENNFLQIFHKVLFDTLK